MHQIAFLKNKLTVDSKSDADESVLAEIFSDRDYHVLEPTIVAAKTAVIDIGAHKGFFVLYARVLNPTVAIYAYEPEEGNFAELKKHLLMNRVENVVVKNVAVAEKEGTVTLNISADSHNHSLVPIEGIVDGKKVNATTLEKILDKMERCDVVKMDCEGAEFQILETAPKSVFEKVAVFFLEYHEFSEEMRAARLKVLLEKKGYKVTAYPSRYDKRMGFLFARRLH